MPSGGHPTRRPGILITYSLPQQTKVLCLENWEVRSGTFFVSLILCEAGASKYHVLINKFSIIHNGNGNSDRIIAGALNVQHQKNPDVLELSLNKGTLL